MNKARRRLSAGNALAEFPIAIGIFLLLMLLPLADLAVIYMGTNAVYSAARIATVQAAKQSDKTTVQNVAQQTAGSASTGAVSIKAQDVKVEYLQVPIAPDDQGNTKPPEPAQSPADTTKYIYQIKITIVGSVSPLVSLSKDMFGSVPGLTVPLTVTATSVSQLENPVGVLG